MPLNPLISVCVLNHTDIKACCRIVGVDVCGRCALPQDNTDVTFSFTKTLQILKFKLKNQEWNLRSWLLNDYFSAYFS